MNLQIFDKYTSKPTRQDAMQRTIAIYKSNGSLSFSSLAASELELTLKHRILIAKDTDTKNQWFISVSEEYENGIKLREKKNGGMCKDVVTFACSCRQVVDAMLQDVKAEKNALFMLGKKAKEIDGKLWYQIVSKPIRIK